MWWLPNSVASDYLILTNQSQNALPLDLSLYDASGKENRQKVILGSFETSRFSLRRLVQAAGLTGSYGGIKVSAAAHASSLDTLHFLFDDTAGFSALLKMFSYDPQTKLEEHDYAVTGVWTLRAPMLALSNPDPALAFPPGTTLRPQLFIRNTIANRSTPLFVSTGAPPAPPAPLRDPPSTSILTKRAWSTSLPYKVQALSRKRRPGLPSR